MRISKISSTRILLLQFISTLIYVLFVYCQTQLINGLEKGKIHAILLAATFVLLLLYLLLEISENMCREKAYADCSIKIKEMAANAYMYQSVTDHNKSSEDYISFFSNEISSALVKTVYVRLFLQKQLVLIVFAFSMLLFLAKTCSIFVLLSAILSGTAAHFLSQKLPKKQREVHDKQSVLVEEILELHKGVREIRINQMEDVAEQDFKEVNLQLENARYNYHSALLNIETIATGQNMLIYILILIIGSTLAVNGMVGVGVFVSAAELSSLILNSWSVVTEMYPIMRGSNPTKVSIESFVSKEKAPYRKILPPNLDVLIEVKDLNIQFENTKPLIHNANISLKKGKKYLLVGESGSGKSSFVECLAGNQLATHGEILFFTDKIAYVPQTPLLFSGTLRDNLLIGREIDENEISSLLAMVGLELDLNMVIETDGNNLSGGQKARVELVRALLSAPDLLIVDEVTANMDRQLAVQINDLLLQTYPNMAVLHVSHSVYSTVEYDYVLQIKDCKIREVIL